MNGRETEAQAFERLLKGSAHFADALNSYRRSTAAVHASILGLLIAAGKVELKDVLDTLHRMGEASVPGRPSEGTARRLAASLVRDELLAMSKGTR